MAKYIYQEKGIKVEGKPFIQPRFSHIRKKDCAEFVKHAAHGNLQQEIELTAAIARLADELACQLAEGNSVELEGIGLFTPTLRMREGKEVISVDAEGQQHKSNAQSVEFGGVNFTAASRLINDCRKNCQNLEHDHYAPDSTLRISRSTREERLQMLLQYLDENRQITVKGYAQLTGLSKSSASRELQELAHAEVPCIERQGRGSHSFYTKNA